LGERELEGIEGDVGDGVEGGAGDAFADEGGAGELDGDAVAVEDDGEGGEGFAAVGYEVGVACEGDG